MEMEETGTNSRISVIAHTLSIDCVDGCDGGKERRRRGLHYCLVVGVIGCLKHPGNRNFDSRKGGTGVCCKEKHT